MNEKKIKLKNYIYLFLILGISIALMVYFYMWFLAYKENKLKTPIMNEYLQVINYNELDNYIIENKEAVIYVSVLNNEKIRNFEDKFKDFIKKNELNNKILYLDLTDVVEDNNLYTELINKYRLKNKSISNVPCFMSFKDGKLSSIYVIDESKYNLSEIKFYLKQEDVIE